MLRSVIRDLTADEVSEAVDGAIHAVRYVKGAAPNRNDVVRATVVYCLTKGAANPLEADDIDNKDKRVKSIILAISDWLRYDYHGVAEVGLWERSRYLMETAQDE